MGNEITVGGTEEAQPLQTANSSAWKEICKNWLEWAILR
jgi:hypothetical protein